MLEYRLMSLALIIVAIAIGVSAITAKRDSTRMIGLFLAAALIILNLMVFAPLILSTYEG